MQISPRISITLGRLKKKGKFFRYCRTHRPDAFPKFDFFSSLQKPRLLLYLDYEWSPFFCPTQGPPSGPTYLPLPLSLQISLMGKYTHAVTKARSTKTKMAAERRSAMSAETAQSPTFMKNISSRPGSISPAVTPFSGALMELDEYR